MRVLITGAAGMYGITLTRRLLADDPRAEVIGVDNFSRQYPGQDPLTVEAARCDRLTVEPGDFADLSTERLEAMAPDAVVHYAARISVPESMDDPAGYFAGNEQGTFRFAHAIAGMRRPPLLIYASSPEVYGAPVHVPMDEWHPLQPRSVYAASKVAGEMHCLAIHRWWGHPVVVLRNFNTFGPHQNLVGYPAVIPAFIVRALRGEPLRVEGGGTQTRDFMYIDDAVDAYARVLAAGPPLGRLGLQHRHRARDVDPRRGRAGRARDRIEGRRGGHSWTAQRPAGALRRHRPHRARAGLARRDAAGHGHRAHGGLAAGGRRLSALVTGGAGFIGRHVVAELLRRGEPVRVLDNLSRSRSASLDAFADDAANLGLVQADVTDADAVNRAVADVETVYHLAADVAVGASVRDPTGAMRANVLGTLVVAEAARRRNLRLVLVSTCHVYAAANAPLAEDAAAIPASPYAASKLAAEVIVQSYARTYGLRLTTVRPFNVYGPWQLDDAEGGVVARFLSRDLAAGALEVHGDGAQTRDFVYVDDCARGIVEAAIEPAVGRTLNLASGAEASIAQLARLIAGDPNRVRHVPHPHPEAEVARYIGDAALAREVLGWTPRVDPGRRA